MLDKNPKHDSYPKEAWNSIFGRSSKELNTKQKRLLLKGLGGWIWCTIWGRDSNQITTPASWSGDLGKRFESDYDPGKLILRRDVKPQGSTPTLSESPAGALPSASVLLWPRLARGNLRKARAAAQIGRSLGTRPKKHSAQTVQRRDWYLGESKHACQHGPGSEMTAQTCTASRP